MKIIKGKIPSAKKVVIYGPEGIGKSTFAARFPDPVFIDTEGSTKDMDVARFERASSWAMLMEQIRYVVKNPDLCKTLVIDTIDWAEQMCVADLCAKNGKKGIEDFGYGNGYVYAKEEFGRFLNLLEDVVERGIHVVLTAHAQLRKFEQPDEMGSYDRWELKLGKKTASQTSPLVKEWADMVLFANYKTMVYNVDGQGAQKGKNKAQGGKRVMYTTHHPCWDAKNRYGLADEVPFDYEVIASVIDGRGTAAVQTEPQATPVATSPAASTSAATPMPPAPASVTPVSPSAAPLPEYMQMETLELPPAPTPPQSSPQSAAPQAAPSVNKPAPAGRSSQIPKALLDLMTENQVDEWDIQNVVAARGYYPPNTPIDHYEPEFISGVLVAAWPQVYGMIKEMKEKEQLPFN